VGRFKSEWNAIAEQHDLPKIEGITGNRLKAVRQRCQDHGPDAVSRAIATVPKCPHWLGENGWRGNFDSLMRPDNFQRMIEGAYIGGNVSKFVSASGYEYRGNPESVMREAERRGDNDTYWAAKRAMGSQSIGRVTNEIVKRASG